MVISPRPKPWGTLSLLDKTRERAYSSAWLERFPDKEEVGGSSPPRPTQYKQYKQYESRWWLGV